MRRLTLIFTFILVSIAILSQELVTDSVSYKSYTVLKYYHGKEMVGDGADELFVIKGNKIETSLSGQKKSFNLINEWKDIRLDIGADVKIVEATDEGGFRLSITLGYDEPSGRNFLIFAYNNISFFYEVSQEEIELPYEDIFLYQQESPDYTKEEIFEFLEQYGNPVVLYNMMLIEMYENF